MEDVRTTEVDGDIAWWADECSSRSEEGRHLGVEATAGFSILGGSSPRIWPRPGSLLLFEEKLRKKGELRDEVDPWRLLQQVSSVSFLVMNLKPRVAGAKQGQ